MSKSYSDNFKKTVHAVDADESPIILIEIDRDDLSVPIRLVNDSANVTHQSNTFIACPFRVSIPDEPEQGLPTASLAIDNVGKELSYWVDQCDWTLPTTCKLIQIMRSDPNVAEWSITMDMTDVAMDSLQITAKLGFEDLFSAPGVNFKYTPVNAPGIF